MYLKRSSISVKDISRMDTFAVIVTFRLWGTFSHQHNSAFSAHQQQEAYVHSALPVLLLPFKCENTYRLSDNDPKGNC